MSAAQIAFRDKLAIARHEISCAAIIVADLLDKREAKESDWQRLTLALQRLRSIESAL